CVIPPRNAHRAGKLCGRKVLRSPSLRVAHLLTQPGAGVGPDLVGLAGRDPEQLGRFGVAAAGEGAEPGPLGGLAGDPRPAAPRLCATARGPSGAGGGGPSGGRGRRAGAPPCSARPLRRAFSTRMRRIASAAAAKKCPRLSHGRSCPPSTSRK